MYTNDFNKSTVRYLIFTFIIGGYSICKRKIVKGFKPWTLNYLLPSSYTFHVGFKKIKSHSKDCYLTPFLIHAIVAINTNNCSCMCHAKFSNKFIYSGNCCLFIIYENLICLKRHKVTCQTKLKLGYTRREMQRFPIWNCVSIIL